MSYELNLEPISFGFIPMVGHLRNTLKLRFAWTFRIRAGGLANLGMGIALFLASPNASDSLETKRLRKTKTMVCQLSAKSPLKYRAYHCSWVKQSKHHISQGKMTYTRKITYEVYLKAQDIIPVTFIILECPGARYSSGVHSCV